MVMRVYNTDNASDLNFLRGRRLVTDDGLPEAKERINLYGSDGAMEAGLEPMEAYPDVLIQPDEYEDRLKEANDPDVQTLPMYHVNETWRPKGVRYNQDGLGYCWTWSGTGCMMTCRAMEDKPTVLLAPVSMGYLVNWANRGNYLESYIRGAREQGVCPVPEGKTFNDLTRSGSFWDDVNHRDLYLLGKVWDCNPRTMVQHCVSGLCYGRSGYIAYNWWGHALELVGIRVRADGTWEWIISNSHNEDDFIILTGSKAIPDECYFFISTIHTSIELAA